MTSVVCSVTWILDPETFHSQRGLSESFPDILVMQVQMPPDSWRFETC